MSNLTHIVLFALVAVTLAQNYEYDAPTRPAPQRLQSGFSGSAQPKPTPIPILKQINRHNEDGSYTYGYEGADGSFKIETKLATGEVKGKYGYTDDTGKVRVVEYGATKYGFEPSGEGITVAPPTLVDETTDKNGANIAYADQYYDSQEEQRPAPRPQARPQQQYSAPQQFAAPQRSSPVPARAQITGAQQLSTTFEYVPQTRPQPQRNYAPAPQPAFRPQQSYAYSAPQQSASPAPIQEDTYEEPAQRPLPRITYAQPAPAPARPAPQQFSFQPQQSARAQAPQQQQPQYAPAPRPQQAARASGGVLDQLAKDYALPQGGSPALHDISFGYY